MIGRGALIAAAVWVAAACETAAPPVTIDVAGDTAEHKMFGLRHTVTVDGVLRARVEADTAYMYEGSEQWELIGVTVHFFDAMGTQTSTVTSDEGTYDQRSKDMEARGNVVGTTPDGRRLTTSVMKYISSLDQLEGPESFVFTAPDENMRGASFTADPDFTRVRITRVRGTPGIRDRR